MQFYDKLINLPLFQGMSSGDLENVVSTIKFDFMTLPRKKVVVESGMPCKHLIILANGSLLSTRECRGWRVTEIISAPALLQPERIFGIRQQYTHTFTCLEKSQLISVSKAETMNLATQFLVFRLNLLNIVSMAAQKALDARWESEGVTCGDRILSFLRKHTLTPGGKAIFHIHMTQLADELQCSRLLVSNELNRLDEEGIITLQRGIITLN